jgi:hypothetical protein
LKITCPKQLVGLVVGLKKGWMTEKKEIIIEMELFIKGINEKNIKH